MILAVVALQMLLTMSSLVILTKKRKVVMMTFKCLMTIVTSAE